MCISLVAKDSFHKCQHIDVSSASNQQYSEFIRLKFARLSSIQTQSMFSTMPLLKKFVSALLQLIRRSMCDEYLNLKVFFQLALGGLLIDRMN